MTPSITGESKAPKTSKYKPAIPFVGSGWLSILPSGVRVINILINQDANGNSFVLNGINNKCQLSIYENTMKRTGINPNTGKPYQDPGYNMSVSLPADKTEEESAPEPAQAPVTEPAQAPVTEPVAALEPPF